MSAVLIRLVVYAYPAFECYKTVVRNGVKKEELRLWCKYWIMVAVISFLEPIVDIVMNSWFPMFGWLKLALFIWKGRNYVNFNELLELVTVISQNLQSWRASRPQLGPSTLLRALQNFDFNVLSKWVTTRNTTNEQRRNQPSKSEGMPCANNCGFFGDPATRNLCSMCFKRD